MRVVAAEGGAVLRCERPEGELLVHLLGDTGEALEPGGLDDDDPVSQRLFPAAYSEDEEAERGFRELTESALRDERLDRIQRCEADVASAPVRAEQLELHLDAEEVDRWIRALNDVRLALGTRLEITDEDDYGTDLDGDPDDPRAGAKIAYLWLTELQGRLVDALAG